MCSMSQNVKLKDVKVRSLSSLIKARNDARFQFETMRAFQRYFRREVKKINGMYMTKDMKKFVIHCAEEALFKALNR